MQCLSFSIYLIIKYVPIIPNHEGFGEKLFTVYFFPIRINLFSVHSVDPDLIPKSNCNVTQKEFMLKKLSSVLNVHTHVKLKLLLEIT